MRKIIATIILAMSMVCSVFATDINTQKSSDNYYIVTFECTQSHFTLDLSEHLKDSINKLTFEVPVDKDYYDKVKVGDKIIDSFRMGSFIMKGSLGKWKIKVMDKRVVKK